MNKVTLLLLPLLFLAASAARAQSPTTNVCGTTTATPGGSFTWTGTYFGADPGSACYGRKLVSGVIVRDHPGEWVGNDQRPSGCYAWDDRLDGELRYTCWR